MANFTPQLSNLSPQTLAATGLYPLSHRFIHVTGQDASKFLQGQLTCDIKKLSTSQSGLGAHCNAKGRMLSSFRIVQLADNHYILRLHASIADSALQALKKYAVFSKANLAISETMAGMGLHGAEAKQALNAFMPQVPTQIYQQQLFRVLTENPSLTQADFSLTADDAPNVCIICTDATLLSYEIYADAPILMQLWQSLSQTIPTFSEQQHRLAEHQQNLAFIEAATVDEFIPQMFNYQDTPALSFEKGCYTGQEIVARMQYLGKLKRRLYRKQLETQGEVQAGDGLALAEGAQNIGHIVSLVEIGAGRYDALVVLTEEGANQFTLFNIKQNTMVTL